MLNHLIPDGTSHMQVTGESDIPCLASFPGIFLILNTRFLFFFVVIVTLKQRYRKLSSNYRSFRDQHLFP